MVPGRRVPSVADGNQLVALGGLALDDGADGRLPQDASDLDNADLVGDLVEHVAVGVLDLVDDAHDVVTLADDDTEVLTLVDVEGTVVRAAIGEMVTTRFNLLDAYRSYYDKEHDDDPAISGIALALDTKKAGNSGKSSAFIREIRFYK